MQYPIIDLITDAYLNNGWTGLDITLGKNLYNESKYPMTQNYVIMGSAGNFGPSSIGACATEDYIDISELIGQTITLNHSPGGVSPGFGFYSSSKSFVTGISNEGNTQQSEPWTITIPNNSNIKFMRFSSANANIGDIQIELGTASTEYEPYNATSDISHRLKLPLPHYFPHPVIDALERAAAGTQTADDTEILSHYLTPLGIGGI